MWFLIEPQSKNVLINQRSCYMIDKVPSSEIDSQLSIGGTLLVDSEGDNHGSFVLLVFQLFDSKLEWRKTSWSWSPSNRKQITPIDYSGRPGEDETTLDSFFCFIHYFSRVVATDCFFFLFLYVAWMKNFQMILNAF